MRMRMRSRTRRRIRILASVPFDVLVYLAVSFAVVPRQALVRR